LVEFKFNSEKVFVSYLETRLYSDSPYSCAIKLSWLPVS
jgi:hypothetical protein